MKSREQILKQLQDCKPCLQENFDVKKLALFGSAARDTANQDSDIDILIAFNYPSDHKSYFGALFFLEDLFQLSTVSE